jgi:hypothetical protein
MKSTAQTFKQARAVKTSASMGKTKLCSGAFVSDTFPLIPPFASRVQELIQENGVSVEMVACAHGNVMPYAQLAYMLGK